eukprot:m.263542 g.263542  ORF g.263542 m.263542 type:complete len:81 (+) comp53679_c0_seq1:122-364(+)
MCKTNITIALPALSMNNNRIAVEAQNCIKANTNAMYSCLQSHDLPFFSDLSSAIFIPWHLHSTVFFFFLYNLFCAYNWPR